LSGVIQGDGHLGVCKLQYLFTLRMKDIEAINRTEKYLDDLKIKSKRFQYNSSTSLMFGIRTTTKEKYFKIKQIIEERDFSNKEFCRGFLAGIFDAEGSCQKNSIRIYNTNSIILKEIKDALTFLGFNYVFEFSHEGTIFPVYSIRLLNSTGGETTEFFQVVDPAIDRKRSIFGKKLKGKCPKIISIKEREYSEEMYDIQTTTGNFIANGMVSHNCHNKELQDGEHLIDIEEIKQKILESLPLISEVILSGGEPLFQYKVVEELSKFAKSLGLKVGIETSGYNSNKLPSLIKENLIDKVYLDVKTFGALEYYKLTKIEWSWDNILNTIAICKNFNIDIQIRTTIFKDYPGEHNLYEIENMINKLGLSWKKQEGTIC